MAYTILNPGLSYPLYAGSCALAVMAKAPRPGKVKTRLVPPLTLEQAAELNICFLKDTTENILRIAAGAKAEGVVSYTPAGDESLFDGVLPPSFALLAQRDGNFGERLLGTAEDLFACGFGSACLIDSDSPTVPEAAYAQAVNALQRPGDRVVLGPSRDGGYYLIGMKQAHAALFNDIHWSTESVYAETVEAVRKSGLDLVELPLWYDVDDGATLDTLVEELVGGATPAFARASGYYARHTREFLSQMYATGDMR